jgi:hypothetical protein
VSLKTTLLALLALTGGCSLLQPNKPTDVARGEYYSAGKPEFDAFFIELHEKQVELLAAPSEPADVRKNLTQLVGLTPDASDDSLKERISQELKQLANKGLRLRLAVPETSTAADASATLYASETSTSTPFRTALPEQATRLVRSRNRMTAAKAELDKLNVSGVELEGKVDPTFRTDGPWKRDEVRKNLEDGTKLITLMQSRAQEVAETCTKLLALLGAVATTDESLGKAAAYAPPPAAAEERTKSGNNHPPVTKSAKPAGAAPAPKSAGAASAPKSAGAAPAPKTPAKRGGDDEGAPAPKPTQGSAPAEIEP